MITQPFTVLLAVPCDIADGDTPRDDTYLTHVTARNELCAVGEARAAAATAHKYEGDPLDYAVLATFHGHRHDLSTGRE